MKLLSVFSAHVYKQVVAGMLFQFRTFKTILSNSILMVIAEDLNNTEKYEARIYRLFSLIFFL